MATLKMKQLKIVSSVIFIAKLVFYHLMQQNVRFVKSSIIELTLLSMGNAYAKIITLNKMPVECVLDVIMPVKGVLVLLNKIVLIVMKA